jgi:hypothetical protein
MRAYFFSILLLSFSLISSAQNYGAKCNIIYNLDFWLRIAHTTYTDRMVLKSGWDEIEGNRMTEIKIQLRYLF